MAATTRHSRRCDLGRWLQRRTARTDRCVLDFLGVEITANRADGSARCNADCLSIPLSWAAAFSIPEYPYSPALLWIASTPQRWTFLKSPYGNLYLRLVFSGNRSSMPRYHFAYSAK